MNTFSGIELFIPLAFVVFAVACLRSISLSTKLLRLLPELAPEYFDLVGRPAFKWNSFNWRANRYLQKLIFNTPDGYPLNIVLRETLRQYQWWSKLAIAVWLVYVALIFMIRPK
jgi:hypothetical protein